MMGLLDRKTIFCSTASTKIVLSCILKDYIELKIVFVTLLMFIEAF